MAILRKRGQRQLHERRSSERNRIYHVFIAVRARTPALTSLRCRLAVVQSMIREDQAGHARTLALVGCPITCTGFSVDRNAIAVMHDYYGEVCCGTARDRVVNRRGPVWQRGFYDRAIRREEDLCGLARYIVSIPLRAGVAE